MEPLVISQHTLQQRLREFRQQRGNSYHLMRLGYFGSYARNEAKPDSDVDIVFETQNPDLLATALMKQELEAWLSRPVDVLRLHPNLHPAFRSRLEREVVYV